MPWALNVGDIIELRIYCYEVNQLGVNTVKYKLVTSVAPLSPQNVADEMSLLLAPKYKPMLPTTGKFLGVSIQDWPARVWASVWSKSGQGDGTGTGDVMPKQVSGMVGWKTESAGRRGRGRIYVPFPTEAMSGADGSPTGAYLTDLDALADMMQPTFVVSTTPGSSWQLGIGDANNAGTFKNVTGYTLPDRWATQRRRGDFGRVNPIPTDLA